MASSPASTMPEWPERGKQADGHTVDSWGAAGGSGHNLRDNSGLMAGALTVVGRPEQLGPVQIDSAAGPALVACANRCSRLLQRL
ncbi:MAG: hypothetical protein ACOCXA_09035 [Planctomycetota bacterium]